jgi:Mn2+/Fe2+ NRAMP family transporter
VPAASASSSGALLVALIAANALNIAADLVAVGSGMTLLHAGLTWVWALLAGITVTAVVMMGSFDRITKVFKLLCVALLVYFAVAVLSRPNTGQLLHGLLVPHVEFNVSFLTLLVAGAGDHDQPVPVLLAVRAPHRGPARGARRWAPRGPTR